MLSHYGTVYDPSKDRDTSSPAVDSHLNYENPKLFAGDTYLPPEVPRPYRIQGMIPEDLNRVYIFFTQIKKSAKDTKPDSKYLGGKPQDATSFEPVFKFPDEDNDEEEEEDRAPLATAAALERKNMDTLRLLGQVKHDYSKRDKNEYTPIDIYVDIAIKNEKGEIRVKGGSSSGMMKVSGPPISAEDKDVFWYGIEESVARSTVWSAAKERTKEERRRAAELTKEQIARSEAAASAMQAEEDTTKP
jgi:hypothetical protein